MAPKARDLSGDTYEQLTIVCRANTEPLSKNSLWLAICSCGKYRVVRYHAWKMKRVTNCGCIKSNKRLASITKHGQSRTKTFQVWADMRSRCSNPNNKHYKDYGERGITVCDAWSDFSNFISDMGPAPQGRSLDRINNEKGYGPENCRWATPKEQGRNRRTNKQVTIFGKTQCVKAWAEDLGISYPRLRYRLSAGYPPELAISPESHYLKKRPR